MMYLNNILSAWENYKLYLTETYDVFKFTSYRANH